MNQIASRRMRWVFPAAVLAVLPTGGIPAVGQQQPAVPALVVEDFEASALGSVPYLWSRPKGGRGVPPGSTAGCEKAELDGVRANKALKLAYSFPSTATASQGVEAGPGGQPLPGSLVALSMMVHGDAGKNAVAVRVLDRAGESFEWQVPVTWMGWRKVTYPIAPAGATLSGRAGNRALDAPLRLEAVALLRTASGIRKGEVMVDNVTAECKFGSVRTLYDTAAGVKPETWRASRVRSIIGSLDQTLVPRADKDVAVLKMEYEYEFGTDSQVEFIRNLTAGEGHGTLVAEIFGDGSNNILRFRMLDGADKPWQGDLPSILVDWSGWKTCFLGTRFLREVEGQDPSAQMSRFPVKFYSLLLDDCSGRDNLPGVESGRKGEIFLGRLLFCSE